MLLVPSPCPCPSRVAFVFWFCSCFQRNNSGTSMGCSALEGSWWDQSSEKPTPRWHLSWKDIAMADAWTLVVAEPVPLWGRLASGSGFPARTRAGDPGISQTRLRPSLLPARPLISPPPAFIISASLCPLEPLGLTLTTGSGRRPSRCMPLVLCGFCK